MRATLKWLGLILFIGVLISWHSQSHYNSHIEKIFAVANQSERVLKAPIQDFSGPVFYLSDLKGKPVLLDFWASWCPSCRASMPELESMHQHYADKLTILAVNVLEPPRDGIKYATEGGYDLRFVHSNKLAAIFKIKVLPTKILLDPEGNVIWANTGHIPFLTHKWLENQL
ncbi:MAG: thioredoxin-like domain-containing protein [Gammaproteobacteria bacterium]|nr:thioredoxin-like domain-containing protein [Gammaproteobacteria bacterium]